MSFRAFWLALPLLVAAPLASASTFTVEQYGVYLGTDLTAYQEYAANNPADYTALVDGIDFTDDPNGFAGEIPGSTPWPAETATGQTGKASAANTAFFARITATFDTFFTDTYTFRTYNDDGVFLFVDGELIINDPSLHAEQQFTGTKTLAAGEHSIELFFFENGGEASLEFAFRDSSGTFALDGGPTVALHTVVPLPLPGVLLAGGLALLPLARRKARA